MNKEHKKNNPNQKNKSKNKKNILIVDDEPLSVTIVMEYLSEAGYECRFVTNAIAAWQLLTAKPKDFDLVIIDRVMPHVGGIELLSKIKEHSELSHIPVIIETAYDESIAYLNAIKQGAVDYIYKPVDRDLLLHIVSNAIK